MPFVKFPLEDILMWYRTNLPGDGDVRHLDRSKPTILLMHGHLSDSTFLDPQFDDARLRESYNLIAFDSRSTGRTQNPLDPSRDSWTEAADLAKAMQILNLPPCHIFACSQPPVLNLLILWPELCLSLTWAGIIFGDEPSWAPDAYQEVLQAVNSAEEIHEMEEVVNGFTYWLYGDTLTEEGQDHFAAYIETQYTGANTPRFLDYHMILLQRQDLTPEELSLIRKPVLIIQAEDSPIYPVDASIRFQNNLTNAVTRRHVIKGPPQLHAVPQYAKTVNTLLLEFLRTLPALPVHQTHVSMEALGKIALSRLASVCGDKLVAERDPRLSSSFSLVSDALRAGRASMMKEIAAVSAKKKPFGILNRDGLPLRRFTERHSQPFVSPSESQPSAHYMTGLSVSVECA